MFWFLFALIVVASSQEVSLTSFPDDPEMYDLPGPYSRIWVPPGGNLAVDLVKGSWKAGNQLWHRFILNHGRYNKEFDLSNTTAWLPLECRYGTDYDDVFPTFLHCYRGTSDLAQRTDMPTLDFVENSEVYACTNVTTIVYAQNQNPHKPKVRVTFSTRSYSYYEQTQWTHDLINRDPDSPGSDVPPQLKSLLREYKYYLNINGTYDRIAELEPVFSTDALFEIVGYINYTNDGSRSTVQNYQLQGSILTTDPVFVDERLNLAHAMLVGPLIYSQVSFDIRFLHVTVPSLQIWTNKYMVMGSTNYLGEINMFAMHVNFLGVVIRTASQGPVNVTDVCITTQKYCTDSVEWVYFPMQNLTCPYTLAGSGGTKCSAKQYSDVSDCVNYLNSKPEQIVIAGEVEGDSRQCRRYHRDVALASLAGLQVHCGHIGKVPYVPSGVYPHMFHIPCGFTS